MKVFNLITEAYRLPSASLSNVSFVSDDTVRIPSGLPWEKISIKVPAKMVISDKIESKVHIYKVSLNLPVLCVPSLPSQPSLFKVKVADGSWRLIGTGNRPYPITTRKYSYPSSPTDNQLPEIDISWSSDRPIPFIL